MYIHGRSRALGVTVPFDPADPGTPVVGVDRRALTDLQIVTTRKAFGDSGLPQAASIDLGGLTAAIDVRAGTHQCCWRHPTGGAGND
jgi:hypothetical protein